MQNSMFNKTEGFVQSGNPFVLLVAGVEETMVSL